MAVLPHALIGSLVIIYVAGCNGQIWDAATSQTSSACDCRELKQCGTCTAAAIVNAMTSHSEDAAVLVNGCFVLGDRAQSGHAGRREVASANGHSAAEAAMEKFPDDSSVQMFCQRLADTSLTIKFVVGEHVTWIHADDDVPTGAVGTVIANDDSGDEVQVQFPAGIWAFQADELLPYDGIVADDTVDVTNEANEDGQETYQAGIYRHFLYFMCCPILVIVLQAMRYGRQRRMGVTVAEVGERANERLAPLLVEHLQQVTCELMPSSNVSELPPQTPLKPRSDVLISPRSPTSPRFRLSASSPRDVERGTVTSSATIMPTHAERQNTRGGRTSIGAVCAVCLDCFAEGDSLLVLPCGHRYHKDCVTNWLKEQFSCPSCRAPGACSLKQLVHTIALAVVIL